MARPLVPLRLYLPHQPQPRRRLGRVLESHLITRGGATVALQQAPDLALQGTAIERPLRTREPSSHPLQRRLDARGEARVHAALLLPPLARAAQQERLRAVRTSAELGFHPVAHRLPVALLRQLSAPLAHLAARRPDQIAPPALLEPGEVVLAHHPAVHHPHPLRQPEARLHRLHDLLDRGHVHPIAREHLVAQRHSLARHHQRDAHLLAVRPVIPAVAALRQRIARRQSLEVRARHVVQQQVVLQREQLPQPRLQVTFDRFLVRQQTVERAVQAVVIHRFTRQRQQVLERGAPVPVLGDVQLARRLAQARDHQYRRHHRPRRRLASLRQQLRADHVQLERSP